MIIKIYTMRKMMGILILSTFFLSANSQSTDNIYGGAENGIVGKIADEYRVTPNGQFCYDIPIATVSGTGGMTPKLSISYNSGNGNGLFGYGFDLKGLSTITRAPRNLYNDNQADVVRFTDADRTEQNLTVSLKLLRPEVQAILLNSLFIQRMVLSVSMNL